MECSVCYERSLSKQSYINLGCHKFCPCILTWVLKHKTCPMCRKEITFFKYKFNSEESNIHIKQRINKEKEYIKILFIAMLLSNMASMFFFVKNFSSGIEMFIVNQIIMHIILNIESKCIRQTDQEVLHQDQLYILQVL